MTTTTTQKKKLGRPKKQVTSTPQPITPQFLFGLNYDIFRPVEKDFLLDWPSYWTKSNEEKHEYLLKEINRCIEEKKPLLYYILAYQNEIVSNYLCQLLVDLSKQGMYKLQSFKIKAVYDPRYCKSPLPENDQNGFPVPQGHFALKLGSLGHNNMIFSSRDDRGNVTINGKDSSGFSGTAADKEIKLRKGLAIYNVVYVPTNKGIYLDLSDAIKALRNWGFNLKLRSSSQNKGLAPDCWRLVEDPQ